MNKHKIFTQTRIAEKIRREYLRRIKAIRFIKLPFQKLILPYASAVSREMGERGIGI